MAVQFTPIKLLQHIKDNNFSYYNSYKKQVKETNESVEEFQNKLEKFRKDVADLKKYSPGITNKSKLEKELSDFVKSYNNMEKSAENITDKNVRKQLSKLRNLFSENEKDLRKIGIKKTNGKLTFDEDEFDDADTKVIDRLFYGKGCFIQQANKIIQKTEDKAEDIKYNITDRNISKTTMYNQEDIQVVSMLTLGKEVASVLGDYNDKVQNNKLDSNDQKNIELDLAYFAQSVYITMPDYQNETLDKIKQLCKDNEGELGKLGFKFDREYKQLTYEGSASDFATQDFKDAYNHLFGENAAFKDTILRYCKEAFDTIIKPKDLGVSIIDEQL